MKLENRMLNACQNNDMVEIEKCAGEGLDVNVPTTDGFHYLTTAVTHGSIEAIPLLVKLGADINFIDDDNKTHIYYAAMYNQSEVMVALYRLGTRYNFESWQCWTWGMVIKSPDVIKAIHKACPDNFLMREMPFFTYAAEVSKYKIEVSKLSRVRSLRFYCLDVVYRDQIPHDHLPPALLELPDPFKE